LGIWPGGKLSTTKRPAALYETTLALSELSGVTMVCGATAAGVARLALGAGRGPRQPAANIPTITSVNGVSDFMATVKRVPARRSIQDSHIHSIQPRMNTDTHG
jgi:hypothetical protein